MASGFWPIAPDLAVKVISPSEVASEVQEKVQDYLQAGTRLIWLVYPNQKLVMQYELSGQVRQIGGQDSLDGGDVIPGFRYELKRLFRER
jgi:Uma2 family endonuclease